MPNLEGKGKEIFRKISIPLRRGTSSQTSIDSKSRVSLESLGLEKIYADLMVFADNLPALREAITSREGKLMANSSIPTTRTDRDGIYTDTEPGTTAATIDENGNVQIIQQINNITLYKGIAISDLGLETGTHAFSMISGDTCSDVRYFLVQGTVSGDKLNREIEINQGYNYDTLRNSWGSYPNLPNAIEKLLK
jgi:hypothetical protein